MTDPMPPVALILGSGGFLGGRLLETFGDRYQALIVDPVSNERDLTRFAEQVGAALDHYPGAALVNCLGVRSGSAQMMNVVNGELPARLVEVASRNSTRLVHIGSAAEVVERLWTKGSPGAPQVVTAYHESKRAGTAACLTYEGAVVLRVYNLHGLPHQPDAGIHRLCTTIEAVLRGQQPEPVVDTTRDYVTWWRVIEAIDRAVELRSTGLVDVCSGIGISIREIGEKLPESVRGSVISALVPPDLFAAAVGPAASGAPAAGRSDLVSALAVEVLACASS